MVVNSNIVKGDSSDIYTKSKKTSSAIINETVKYYDSDGSLSKYQFLKQYAVNGITAEDIYNANSTEMIWHYRSADAKFTSNETCTITRVPGENGILSVISVKNFVQYYNNSEIDNSPTYNKLKSESDFKNYNILNGVFVKNIIYDNTTNKFYEVVSKNKYEEPKYAKITGGEVNIATMFILHVTAKELQSSEYITIGDYLRNLGPSQKIRADLTIIIPTNNSGSVEIPEAEKTEDNRKDDLPPLGEERRRNDGTGNTVTPTGMPVLTPNEVDYAGPKECFFSIYERGQLVAGPRYLPIFPNEISDRNSSTYNPTSILGRSVAYQTYNGSSRSVNLTLELHEELCDDYTYVPNLVKLIESVAYPGYETGQVNPCEMELVLGNFLRIRGIVSGVSTTWKAPIIDGRLVHCIVAFDITETTGPYSRAEVARMGAMR